MQCWYMMFPQVSLYNISTKTAAKDKNEGHFMVMSVLCEFQKHCELTRKYLDQSVFHGNECAAVMVINVSAS